MLLAEEAYKSEEDNVEKPTVYYRPARENEASKHLARRPAARVQDEAEVEEEEEIPNPRNDGPSMQHVSRPRNAVDNDKHLQHPRRKAAWDDLYSNVEEEQSGSYEEEDRQVRREPRNEINSIHPHLTPSIGPSMQHVSRPRNAVYNVPLDDELYPKLDTSVELARHGTPSTSRQKKITGKPSWKTIEGSSAEQYALELRPKRDVARTPQVREGSYEFEERPQRRKPSLKAPVETNRGEFY